MLITHKEEEQKKKPFIGVTIQVETLDELRILREAMGAESEGYDMFQKIFFAYEKYL